NDGDFPEISPHILSATNSKQSYTHQPLSPDFGKILPGYGSCPSNNTFNVCNKLISSDLAITANHMFFPGSLDSYIINSVVVEIQKVITFLITATSMVIIQLSTTADTEPSDHNAAFQQHDQDNTHDSQNSPESQKTPEKLMAPTPKESDSLEPEQQPKPTSESQGYLSDYIQLLYELEKEYFALSQPDLIAKIRQYKPNWSGWEIPKKTFLINISRLDTHHRGLSIILFCGIILNLHPDPQALKFALSHVYGISQDTIEYKLTKISFFLPFQIIASKLEPPMSTLPYTQQFNKVLPKKKDFLNQHFDYHRSLLLKLPTTTFVLHLQKFNPQARVIKPSEFFAYLERTVSRPSLHLFYLLLYYDRLSVKNRDMLRFGYQLTRRELVLIKKNILNYVRKIHHLDFIASEDNDNLYKIGSDSAITQKDLKALGFYHSSWLMRFRLKRFLWKNTPQQDLNTFFAVFSPLNKFSIDHFVVFYQILQPNTVVMIRELMDRIF
ncbi:MAG: hypothetical protein OXC40_04630, partial [Proteobacteria bacterium]|nr:hypothetical protein [Pseudomonadota bacterium]